jgi:hypothetical protein
MEGDTMSKDTTTAAEMIRLRKSIPDSLRQRVLNNSLSSLDFPLRVDQTQENGAAEPHTLNGGCLLGEANCPN